MNLNEVAGFSLSSDNNERPFQRKHALHGTVLHEVIVVDKHEVISMAGKKIIDVTW